MTKNAKDHITVGCVRIPMPTAADWVRDYTDPRNITASAPYAYPAYDHFSSTTNDPLLLSDGDLLAPVLLNVRLPIRSFYALQASGAPLRRASQTMTSHSRWPRSRIRAGSPRWCSRSTRSWTTANRRIDRYGADNMRRTTECIQMTSTEGATEVWQARIGRAFAAELKADADVLGLNGRTDIVKAALQMRHRRAAEERMARGVDAFYEGRAPALPIGVLPVQSDATGTRKTDKDELRGLSHYEARCGTSGFLDLASTPPWSSALTRSMLG